MHYGLDQATAEYCLEMLSLQNFGPNGLHYRILALIEGLATDGVAVVNESVITRFLQLPDEIAELGSKIEEELEPDPIYRRLHNIGIGQRALLVIRLLEGQNGMEAQVWSAAATIKEILRTFNHPIEPDLHISESELGLREGELDSFPDPGIRIQGGWTLWADWLWHREDEEVLLSPFN